MKLSFAVRLARFTLILFLSPSVLCAQTVARPSGGVTAADAAWQSFTALRRPPPPPVLSTFPAKPATPGPPATPAVPSSPVSGVTSVSAKVTPAQILVATQQAADRSRSVAQAAKDFYTRYPAHPNAPEARKVEATAALSGVR